jgi:hypothetical protein
MTVFIIGLSWAAPEAALASDIAVGPVSGRCQTSAVEEDLEL